MSDSGREWGQSKEEAIRRRNLLGKQTMFNTEQINRIGALIRTQDNRITADPIFVVQQRKRIWGVEVDYTDSYAWLNRANDYVEATEVEASGLDAMECAGNDTGDWEKVGYVETWEFVTACFTEHGCKDYIAANGHNMNEPRIYAASAYRNREFIAVREMLATFNQIPHFDEAAIAALEALHEKETRPHGGLTKDLGTYQQGIAIGISKSLFELSKLKQARNDE